MMKLNVNNKLALLFGSGVIVLLTGGYLGWFGLPSIMHGRLAQFKRLDDKENFELWAKPPVAMEFKVYFFNVSNPNDVLKGALPDLQEVGPYIYEQTIWKEIMNSTNRNYFRYMKHSSFKFSKEKSKSLRDTDIVTILNLPLMGVGLYLERNMPMALDFFENAIPFIFPTENKLFLNDSVANLLFDGVTIRCSEETIMFCTAMKMKPIKTLFFDETTGNFNFAFFKHKNGSSGPFEADKGFGDIGNVGQIITFQDLNVLNTWVPNSTCDSIKGTDGTIFKPFISNEEMLHVFEPDICYSGSVEFDKEEDYLGIPASRFVGSKSNFAEDETNCRCPREDYSDPSSFVDCLSYGLIDLTPCQGAPVIASQPHFYEGNDQLRFTDSLRAIASKHETYTVIDILAGIPLKGQKRLQLNIQLKHIDDVTILENVTNIIFPILWVEEGVELNADILKPLITLHKVISIIKIGKWILLGFGIALITSGAGYYIYDRHFKNNIEDAVNQQPLPVLFNKVTRKDVVDPYATSNAAKLTQYSPSTLIRERINNNINTDNNYIMTLNSSLYPNTLDARNLERKSNEFSN